MTDFKGKSRFSANPKYGEGNDKIWQDSIPNKPYPGNSQVVIEKQSMPPLKVVSGTEDYKTNHFDPEGRRDNQKAVIIRKVSRRKVKMRL